MNPKISISKDEIATFCKRWQVTKLALFGSMLRDDFGPESDVDILARFEEEARHTLFDLGRMEEELETIFGRKVDFVCWRGVEQSRNYIRRKAILQSAETIYAATFPALRGRRGQIHRGQNHRRTGHREFEDRGNQKDGELTWPD